MEMKKTKLGIVLSGGGAKGAYEAGFLKALSELNIQPDALAGTSIGALNGSVYAAQKDTKNVAKMLEDIWHDMASSEALKFDKKKAFLNIVEVIAFFSPLAPVHRVVKTTTTILRGCRSQEGVLTTEPAENILEKYAPVEKLLKGLPFYVGVTESSGNMIDTLRFLGLSHSGITDYIKVQSLNTEDMYKIILASAALPLLFDAVTVNGKNYRDGCLSSLDNAGGNTPIKPLVENEQCTHIIICHLDHGSYFNRHEWKNVNIIEIRPTFGTFSSDLDPLRFSIDKIDLWIEQGYKDAVKILKDTFAALNGKYERITSEYRSDQAIQSLINKKFSIPDDY
ncbi:patatin-like phospholipase family protein [Sulfurospirillum cavolei]|uniref:patatin-like phospholipase family protein n=1 Tax=Sulfurospirillum cavolei TaxID=366522 RepID=UPI000764A1A8|nr:patatin-like phospholipase family protein [Sulfurospirillum cavolei]